MVLVFLLLTLDIFHTPFSNVSIVDFEQVNISWVVTRCMSFSVGGGRLFERILQNKHLTEANCVIYIKQILQGLHHLHARNICHLDIKVYYRCYMALLVFEYSFYEKLKT